MHASFFEGFPVVWNARAMMLGHSTGSPTIPFEVTKESNQIIYASFYGFPVVERARAIRICRAPCAEKRPMLGSLCAPRKKRPQQNT